MPTYLGTIADPIPYPVDGWSPANAGPILFQPYLLNFSPYNYPHVFMWTFEGVSPYLTIWYSGSWHPWWTVAQSDRPPPPVSDGPLRTSGGDPVAEPPETISTIRVTSQYIEIISTDYSLGGISIFEPNDAVSINGASTPPIEGELIFTEVNDIVAISGSYPDTLMVTEQSDQISISGEVTRKNRRVVVTIMHGA